MKKHKKCERFTEIERSPKGLRAYCPTCRAARPATSLEAKAFQLGQWYGRDKIQRLLRSLVGLS
jgi:hypothetical protein